METLAYGPLALSPATFWALTPREFVLLCEGFRWREDRTWEKLAWLAAHVLAPWGFQGSPKDLLPTPVDRLAETQAMDTLLGTDPTAPEDAYEAMMAAQRAKGLNRG